MPYQSRVANDILYTPFDSKSVGERTASLTLTENEFLEKCYVEPKFKKRNQISTIDDDLELYDYAIKYNQLLDKYKNQESDYENFMRWMTDNNNSKIYTISGNAGTGKTTFIKRLEYDNPNKSWLIFDIANSKDYIEWFGSKKTEIEEFNIPYNKMSSIVLAKLKTLLFGNAGDSVKSVLPKLKNILKIYRVYFHDNRISGCEYFDELLKIMSQPNWFQKDFKLIEEAAQYTVNFFEKLKEQTKTTPRIFFRNSLDILLIAACCVKKSDYYVLVFDNLERFVGNDEIYNRDLDEMRIELSSYSKGVNEKAKVYRSHFKFIMGIRSCSNRMCRTMLNSADELPSDLNITGWFLIDDIISSKLKWYNEHNIPIENIETVSQIMCDLRKCDKHVMTGLQLFIYPLFNDNMRLITDFIGSIVEKSSNEALINKYLSLWEENTSASRFAARSIIKGLIYKELDNNDNLFHNLQLYTQIERKKIDENDDEYGLSYVRKILTILYNNGGDVSLERVIAILCGIQEEDVQQYWNEYIPDKNKNSISEILYYMNSYNRRVNDWVQFIDMQILGKKTNIAVYDTQKLKKLIDMDMASITLRIMPAGEAYIRYIVMSFEFFSYRFVQNYYHEYKPLFSVIPTLEEINNYRKLKDLPCIQILEYVKENALKCIKNIRKRVDIEVYLLNNKVGKNHIQRIRDHHQGFINLFVTYLKQKYPNEIESNEKMKALIEECINIKSQYNV